MIVSNKKNSIVLFLVIVFIFQSCKTYQESISLSEAAIRKTENLYKVTMLTGEELIVENIEIDNEMYFGTTIKEAKRERILIDKTKVKMVQEMNPKASKSINGVGVGVGIGAIVLAILMFGS